MSISKKIIPVTGEKIKSLVLSENEMRLLNKGFSTIEEFNEQFDKKLTLVTKNNIKYSDIKLITKESSEEEVVVMYSGTLGMNRKCKIEFDIDSDREEFYTFIQEQKKFKRTDETMTTLNSLKPLLIGLAITLAIVIFGYFQAIDVASPDFIENDNDSRSGRRTRLFHSIIKVLGTNGVLIVGLAIIGFILYKIWNRYKNPPVQTKFVPSNL
jgi:hypothetical protein